MTPPIPCRVAMKAIGSHYLESPTGCHISTYSVASHGYAQIGWSSDEGRWVTTAHRAAWVSYTGKQIPDGYTIDHMCKQRRCVNPDHLRMLTNFENARRTQGRDWPLGMCVNGHGNEHLHRQPSGKRVCILCSRKSSREGQRRRRERLRSA